MNDRDQPDDEIIGARFHAQSITKFLWGVAATLVGAFVIASFGFAWRVNSDLTELHANGEIFREKCAETRRYLDDVHTQLDGYPAAAELTSIRVDVSQLQFATTATTQVLNELTRTVRDLHPWPVQQRPQGAPAPP